MNFDKESNLIFCGAEGGRRWEGERGSETKTVSQTVKRGQIKKKHHTSTQCKACDSINISKYVNNFLKHNPYTSYFELSSK